MLAAMTLTKKNFNELISVIRINVMNYLIVHCTKSTPEWSLETGIT